jgi:hypothetical protein
MTPGLKEELTRHKTEMATVLEALSGSTDLSSAVGVPHSSNPARREAADEEAAFLRVIERDQGLPQGTLQLFPPPRGCRGCEHCRGSGQGPPPGAGEDLFSTWLRIAKQKRKRRDR